MKQRPGVLLKNEAPWSKQNAFATALKERYAKTCFQIPNLLRNTRLRNSEPVSGAAKASRFGDRKKIAEMTNVQRLRHGKRNIVRRACQMQSASLSLRATARENLFRLDYGSRFCLHRQNLLRYFQNLEMCNDFEKPSYRRRFLKCSAGGGM